MNVTLHDVSLEGLDQIAGIDSLCLFIDEEERPLQGVAGYADWRLCGGLSRVLKRRFFIGAVGEQLLVPTGGQLPAARIFVLGVGRSSKLSHAALDEAMTSAARMLSKAEVQGVAIEIPGAGRLEDAARVKAFSMRFLPAFSGSRVAVLAEKPLRAAL